MLWTKDRTLFNSAFAQNLVFIKCTLAELSRTNCKVCFGGKLVPSGCAFSSQPEIYKLYETQRGAGFTACPVFHLRACCADWKSSVAI